MNKLKLSLLIVFMFIFLNLNAVQKASIRGGTIFIKTTEFYHHSHLPTSLLTMEDNSIWEIFNPPMIKKDPFTEDPPFYFRLTDWDMPMHVKIDNALWLLKKADPNSHYSYMSDHPEKILEFPYIIENLETGKYAFARPIALQETIKFFVEYSQCEYERGYREGVISGQNASFDEMEADNDIDLSIL